MHVAPETHLNLTGPRALVSGINPGVSVTPRSAVPRTLLARFPEARADTPCAERMIVLRTSARAPVHPSLSLSPSPPTPPPHVLYQSLSLPEDRVLGYRHYQGPRDKRHSGDECSPTGDAIKVHLYGLGVFRERRISAPPARAAPSLSLTLWRQRCGERTVLNAARSPRAHALYSPLLSVCPGASGSLRRAVRSSPTEWDPSASRAR